MPLHPDMKRLHLACGPVLWCALVLTACEEDTTGFASLNARLGLDAESVVLGERYLGTRSAVVLQVRASGNAAVRLALAVEGDGAGAFLVEPTLVVNADSQRGLRVEFVPDRPGPLDAVLRIDHDADSTSPLRVTLHGVGRELPGCDDRNPCTDDWFDVQSETCTHRAREGSCDDASACTRNDRCVEGSCVGESIRCVDAQSCTLDTCDPATGCVFVPEHDRCGDDDPCTEDVCSELLGCLNPPKLEGSLCGPPSCAELALCIAGQCIHSAAPDGFPCEDGDVCTTGDRCRAGTCTPGDGDPFGRIGPFEIDLLQSDREVQKVLAVGEAEGGGFDLVVLTDPAPYVDDCDTNAYDYECCGGWGGGGEIRWLRLSATGVVFENRLLAVGQDARAVLRGSSVYVASLVYGDYVCDPSAQISILRAEPDGTTAATWVVAPPGAIVPIFDLAVSDEQVALAVQYPSMAVFCDALPPVCAAPDAAQLVILDHDLALLDERQLVLAEVPSSVEDLDLDYHEGLLDLAFERVTYQEEDRQACAEPWQRETHLLRDAMGATPTVEHVLLGDHSQVHALSFVTATYPAGALLTRGRRDITQAVEPNIDPPPGTGDGCVPYEVVRLFTSDASGQMSSVEALRHDDSARIEQVAAVSALGRLGVLLVDSYGGLQAVIPAQGPIPELSLDLSLPVVSGRSWHTGSAPATWSTSSRVLAAGVSTGDPPQTACPPCDDPNTPPNPSCGDECNPDDFGPPPSPVPPLRRIVVAGVGCGMQAP